MVQVPKTVVRGSVGVPASGYALHVTERDELVHLHWGPGIALADAEALAARPLPDDWSSFDSRLDGREEYRSRVAPASSAACPYAPPTDGAAPSGPSWPRDRRRENSASLRDGT
ncbi:hypothetical protein GCM10023238_30540 [Streptomyces heliomycini]